MNRIHITKWLTCVLVSAVILPLDANPTGGQVASGSAKIAGQGTTAVTVNQASNLTIINWQTFSINAGESTTFVQPSASSAALNRVLGGQTSLINGTLTANGQLYLVNGNGVIVGPGGVVTANAFTASTRDISDADFLAGNLHFTGSGNAGVQNFGTINALGGNVVLIGKTVDNEGTINALKGTSGLIAGDDVLLAQKNADGSTITVNPSSLATGAIGQTGVKNGGSINAAAAELKAANGNIYALAIQNAGTVRATTVQKQGGHIWLTSDSGSIVNSGTLDASATAAGGHGGSVVAKSAKGNVTHSGKIIAEGGQGGVGGNAEISGQTVGFTGTIDLTAPGGTLGNFLLDPTDMDIVTGGGSSLTGSTVDPSAIVAALNGANVTLQADNSITLTSTIDASGDAGAGNLTLETLTLNLNAGIKLNGTLFGTATTVNVGAGGLVQNGVDAAANGGTVNLAATTYDLNSEVLINKDLTINGAGNGTILDGQNNTRVMEIDGTSSGVNVMLNNLTLQNGYVSADNGAGLLINASNGLKATVTINNSLFTGNEADGSNSGDGGGFGGAIANNAENGGTIKLTITNSTISNNSVYGDVDGGGGGAGIYNDGQNSGSATLVVENSTISNNSAFNTAGGTGIFSIADYGGTTSVTLSGSTIANNTGDEGMGGGIYNDGQESGSATVVITNSTISGNSLSDGLGGGIANLGSDGSAPLTITNSTIANNTGFFYGAIDNDGFMGSAPLIIANSTITGNYGSFTTGGILNDASSLTISNTILADNTSGGSNTESDYRVISGGTINSLGYNIYGQNGSTGGFTGAGVATTDILLGGAISSILATDGSGNPLLANNGGPTQTIALVSGSIAIDAGNPISTLTIDQRGAARGGVGKGLNAGSRIDIGAYEATSSYVVTNAQDDDSIGSLRAAIGFGNADFNANPANTVAAIPQITFDTTGLFATAQIITLEEGELRLTGSMDITGTSAGVTINANNASRVMEIDGTASGDTVNLSNLTLENGNDQSTETIAGTPIPLGDGGGLFIKAESGNKATVSISDSTISNNSVNDVGGGIYNDGRGAGNAILTITDSTFTGNSVKGDGGGIYNDGGSGGNATVTIIGSTFTGNSAGNVGGGIANGSGGGTSTMTITRSTISGNSTDVSGDGGGIANYGTLTIAYSTISGNSTAGGIGSNPGGNGGGIENVGTLTIMSSTISGNSTGAGGMGNTNHVGGSGGNGGGIDNNGTLTITSSTIANNSTGPGGRGGSGIPSGSNGNVGGSGGNGGGIENAGGTLTISNSTLADNSVGAGGMGGPGTNGGANGLAGASGNGGGVDNNGGVLLINATILAGNTNAGTASDYSSESGSLVYDANNLIGVGDPSSGFVNGINGDIVGSSVSPINPLLGQLQNNGGPTETMALTIGSPAIGAGGANIGGYELDQRGLARPATNISIGAYEAGSIGSPFIVTTNVDPATGDLFGSLRTALNYSNANPFLDPTVTFDPLVFSTQQTITLQQGQLLINSSLNIDGPAAGVTINANNASRVLEIDGTAAGNTVNLSNLILIGGNGNGANDNGSGGGLLIYTANGTTATVTLTDSTVTGNTATGLAGFNGGDASGGGIANTGSGTLTITDSTISNNSAIGGAGVFNGGTGYGGGIDNVGTLTITGSTISGNSATGSSIPNSKGGGIYNGGAGTLTINSSTISNNTAGLYGGGIDVENSASISISTSTISGNKAVSTGSQGGGIMNYNTTAIITNSTISGNSSTDGGGGIESEDATMTIQTSTISGNSSSNTGGGVDLENGSLTISGSTITGNNLVGGGPGAGIHNTSTLTLSDTILAGNGSSTPDQDYFGPGTALLIDNGHNLYMAGGGFTPGGGVTTDVEISPTGTSGDITSVLAGTESGGIFTPTLANNGGLTQTIALVVGSPAYLAGGANTGGELDQRGFARGSTISIGAWDYNPSNFNASSLVVTTNADTVDVIGSVPVTLRDAIFYGENGNFTDPTITFEGSVFTGGPANLITLNGSELLITTSLNIDASAVGGVTLNANNASRVMEIDGTTAGDAVTLDNLTIENGNGVGFVVGGNGGGLLISNDHTSSAVTINNSTFTGNTANNDDDDNDGEGGGIYQNSNFGTSTLIINHSTVSGNSALQGGGIYSLAENGSATLTINASTISGNSSGDNGQGGGIYNLGDISGIATLTINASTISGNSTGQYGQGGGIYNLGLTGTATATISNSTISGNTNGSGGSAGGIYSISLSGSSMVTISDAILAGNSVTGVESDYSFFGGTLTNKGYNLFATGGGITGNGTNDVMIAALGSAGDIRSVLAGTESGTGDTLAFNPTLANNGGPTQTIALVLGSAAIDAGDPTAIGTADQRGVIRGDGSFTGNASDIGAYEAQIIDVKASDVTTTYGVAPTLTYTVTNGDATGLLSGSLALITPENNAGTYTGDIGQGSLAATSPYLIDFTAGTLKINQATLTITAVTDGKTYNGNTVSSAAPVVVSGLVTGDSVTDLTQAFESKNVLGTNGSTLDVTGYTINDGNGGNNYTVTLQTATGTITPAALTVSATTDTKIFDNTINSGATPTTSTLYGTDTVTGLSQAFESKNVMGTNGSTLEVTGYTVNDGNNGNNYAVTLQTATGTITPAALTISAVTDSKTYDSTMTSSGLPTNSALFGTDTVTGLSQAFESKNVLGTNGSTLEVTGYTVNDGNNGNNYAVTLQTATGTITPAALTISAVTDSKTYDGTTISSGAPTNSALFGTDTVTGMSQAFESKNVMGANGSTLEVTGYTVNDGNNGNNYAVTLQTAAGTINPVTLTYTANPASAQLGQPFPVFGGTVTGFVHGEDQSSATTGTLTFTTTATQFSPPGRYAINGSGLTADDGNYVFVQAPINAKAFTIGAFPFGQPGGPFANVSAQFNANANYNTFFTQGWFPLFDPGQSGWLVPVFSTGNEPHQVYSNRQPKYQGHDKKPKHVIGSGSSSQLFGQTGAY